MYSTHEAELDLPALPLAARHVHIVPALSHVSLLSMGQLCDSGCRVTFDAVSVTVHHHERLLLTGERTPATGLWHLSLVPPDVACTARAEELPLSAACPLPCSTCASVVQSATPSELVAFAHAALFSPSLSTLHGALERGFLPNFLGLTARKLRTHPPPSVAMVKGHLDQTRKNQRSTKPAASLPDDADTTSAATVCRFPNSDPDNQRTHHCFASIVEPPTGQIHTDQTGKFVVASSTGNNYILVLYDYDSNSILVAPMRSRTGPCILAAFQGLHARLVAAGLRPRLHRLDNECSVALKQFLVAEDIDFQLVPPGMHRRNAAERAIRTFKNHFIAGLCSVDKNFPLHLWDKLLPQAELTLNLLRGSRINPKLSAHAQLHGAVDFNRTPIAPPGIRVLVHVKPAERTTWSPHGADGWYTGPALESYRCYTVWLWDTRATRVCDTLSWFPTKITMPLASSNDLILAGIHDILHALKHPSPGSPLAPLADSHHRALTELTSILTSLAAPPTNPLVNGTALAPLRVETPTPVGIALPVPATATSVDPPLRVGATTPPSAPPSLVASRRVQFAPLPSDTIVDTFRTTTGFVGKSRRRYSRRHPRTPPGPTSKTIHPRKLVTKHKLTTPPAAPTPRRPVVPAVHHHGTRANVKRPPLHHIAATARALLLDAARPTPAADAPLPPDVHCAFHGNAFNPDTGQLAEYRELSQCSEGPLWQHSNAEEIGRLAQGYGDVKGTNTMFFIPVTAIPADRKATYLRVVVASRPEKVNPRRVRWTVGGDKVDYPYDVSTKTADLTTAKLLFNSVLSTPNAKFMATDLKGFYLGTPMARYEYMRIPIGLIPDVIIALYNLLPLVTNGHVFVEIRRGMYGLPQAGRLANDQLIKFMAPHGYHPVALTPGLWKPSSRDILFSLVVDDFGVRYTSQADADHLITTLERHYQVSVDWTGTRYCGLTLTWDYVRRTCDLSMPGYIARALQRFQHVAPTKPEHSPHPWQRPTYGAKTQFAPEPDTAAALDATDKTQILAVLGTLLYYARAVDSTLLTAIGELATEQAGGTKTTMDKLAQLLNYCATHPDATVRFTASDMLLAIESDASYLSVVKARSRAAGYFYLTSQPTSPNAAFKPNGAVHVLCQIMREVLSSAAEAELGALFHNGKEACPLRIALEEMGHPQPATPMATDNSTASGIATDTVKQKRSKAVDMRFYWIRDRVRQGQFRIYWRKGNTNRADYFSKHHPASHHQAIRSTYLYSATNPTKNYFDCLADTELLPTALALTTVDPGEGVLLFIREFKQN
ncbi:Reverse transcriptase (RNA-dependent DNA polymerase) [Fragilaria crotonensis]|nr:Reverse transcriptase (RNA-dependent DNA polymerase) [Fragilaria crotonensis]